MTDRRRFIVTAGGTMAAVAAAATVDAPYVIAQPKIQWPLSTAYPPALDVLNGAAQRLAKIVEETSGGRFRIEVFPGRPDHATVRLFRWFLAGGHRGVHRVAAILERQRARHRVVCDHPVRHERPGHGRLLLPGRTQPCTFKRVPSVKTGQAQTGWPPRPPASSPPRVQQCVA